MICLIFYILKWVWIWPLLMWKQYRIICTTELAAAQEKLNELYRQKEEITKLNSPLYLLQRIQGMNWHGVFSHINLITVITKIYLYYLLGFVISSNDFAEAMNKTDEESENLHHQFLDREIDLGAFLQKYKKLRTAYHRKSLINLAAKTSNIWASHKNIHIRNVIDFQLILANIVDLSIFK